MYLVVFSASSSIIILTSELLDVPVEQSTPNRISRGFVNKNRLEVRTTQEASRHDSRFLFFNLFYTGLNRLLYNSLSFKSKKFTGPVGELMNQLAKVWLVKQPDDDSSIPVTENLSNPL